jgi:predicted phage baseplate assembly protein
VQADEGEDAIQTVPDPKGHADQYWVTWHEVPNFYGSGPRRRHYVLDHVKGEVTFGDGACGLIPPVLPGNIRMTNYHSGGGIAGNQPAQAVTKLASAVPYIQKVVNWMPSSGGTDAEANSMLLERGSRGVRHGGRAVTLEDFEDLAMLASRDVARAKCVPLYDLSAGPDAGRMRPGLISLIVLPSSPDPMPVPSTDLLERVRIYLDAWRLPTIEMVVVGPEYVRVDVEAEIVVEDPGDANDVELAVLQELDRYLHPVHGGPDGSGWEFGRLPRKFDLSVLIERIPRVNHVRDLRVSTAAGHPGVEKTGNVLICCGQHKIAMVLEEQGAVEFA